MLTHRADKERVGRVLIAIIELDPGAVRAEIGAELKRRQPVFAAGIFQCDRLPVDEPPPEPGKRHVAQRDHLRVIGVGRLAPLTPFGMPDKRTGGQRRADKEGTRHGAARPHGALDRMMLFRRHIPGERPRESRHAEADCSLQKEVADCKRANRPA